MHAAYTRHFAYLADDLNTDLLTLLALFSRRNAL
jgi:hypothetical protein